MFAVQVLTQDEVGQPFTLQSVTSRSEPGPAPPSDTHSASLASGLAAVSSGCQGPNFRAKPGHCNGSLNSPGCNEMPPSLPPLALSGIPSCGLSSSAALSPPPPPPPNRNGADSAASSISLPSSPKIARSFRSRISVTLRSPPGTNGTEDKSSSYVAGESVDGIPALSPPSYRTPTLPSLTGNGSALCIGNGKGIDGLSNVARPSSSSMDDPSLGTTSTLKKSNRESPSASSLRKYAIQNNNMHKTESNLSVNSMERLGGSVSDTASKDASSGVKRTSVVFEEPKPGGNFVPGSSALLSSRQISTSKAVNGILRKGSLRGNEEDKSDKSSRKTRKSGDHRHRSDRSHSGSSSKASKHRSSKNDESTTEEHDGGRSSRSRSNSTKSTKSEKREQNNLALTRDLPWCGCWGNGCL